MSNKNLSKTAKEVLCRLKGTGLCIICGENEVAIWGLCDVCKIACGLGSLAAKKYNIFKSSKTGIRSPGRSREDG